MKHTQSNLTASFSFKTLELFVVLVCYGKQGFQKINRNLPKACEHDVKFKRNYLWKSEVFQRLSHFEMFLARLFTPDRLFNKPSYNNNLYIQNKDVQGHATRKLFKDLAECSFLVFLYRFKTFQGGVCGNYHCYICVFKLNIQSPKLWVTDFVILVTNFPAHIGLPLSRTPKWKLNPSETKGPLKGTDGCPWMKTKRSR